MDDDWMSTKEAAHRLDLTPGAVRIRIQKGILTAAKDEGGCWRIDPASVERLDDERWKKRLQD